MNAIVRVYSNFILGCVRWVRAGRSQSGCNRWE